MADRRTARMNARIRVWQEALGLGNWRIGFSPTPPDPDAKASSQISVPTKAAAIQVQPECPEGLVDREIVHELLHVLLAEQADLFAKGIETRGKEAIEVLEHQYGQHQEWIIERLVDAITGIPHGEWAGETHEHHIWSEAFPVA